jgi:predicted dehydrogenase
LANQKKFKVAIVGCGQIAAQKHLPSLRKIRGVDVVAVCDKNEGLAKTLAAKAGIRAYYSDLAELLRNEKIDIIDICAPPQAHQSIATQAMTAGCHVLTEKPMALSLVEAQQIALIARETKVKICVIHNELFMPVVMKAREKVRRNAIGDIVEMSILDTLPAQSELVLDKNHWSHRLPGGIFGEMLPHPISLALAFVGDLQVLEVFSRNISGRDWIVADELRVILKNKKSTVTIIQSVNVAEDTTKFDLIGTKTGLRVELWNSVLLRHLDGADKRLSRARGSIHRGFAEFACTAEAGFNVISGRHRQGHYVLMEKFIASLRDGTEPPVTLEEALTAVKVYEAITNQIKRQ